MYGADAQELEDLVRRMTAGAEQLDHIRNQLRSQLHVDAWRGSDAQMYRTMWSRTYEGHMTRAAAGLRETAQGLRRNAQQQRNASTADGPAGAVPGHRNPAYLALPGVLAGVGITGRRLAWFYGRLGDYETGRSAIPADIVKQLPGLPWAVTAGRGELVHLATMGPSAQAAWWAGLTDDQRAALLFAYPGLLLSLRGLPADVTAAATTQYRLSMAGKLARESVQETVAGGVNLGVVKVGAEASAAITRFEDHAEVTLTLTGDLGKEFSSGNGSVGVGVEGGVAVTYRFLSVQDAQDFVSGLKERLAPNLLRSLAHDDASDYLRLNGWARQSTVATVAVTGSAAVSLGGMKAHVSGAAGGTYDIDTHERTLFVEMSGGASAHSGGASVGGDLSGKVALQVDAQGQITSATVSGTVSANGSTSSGELVKSLTGTDAPVDVASTRGEAVTFSAAVDVHDPAVQAHLLRLAEHPGDPVALRGLLAASDAQITVTGTTSTSMSIDAGAVSGRHTVDTAITKSALVKPAGGPWVSVPTQ